MTAFTLTGLAAMDAYWLGLYVGTLHARAVVAARAFDHGEETRRAIRLAAAANLGIADWCRDQMRTVLGSVEVPAKGFQR